MMVSPQYDITKDNLSGLNGHDSAFVTFGETMMRDTPADMERPERTRLVHLSLAGSELSLAMGLSRLGVSAGYITRVPENPYGRSLRNIAREQGLNTDYIVWAPATEPIGRYICEMGRTPRVTTGVYQRMYSAASRLDAGMVDWQAALRSAKLFHITGISFGLSTHSGYDRNYNLDAFNEAIAHKPANCLVGMDFNYRATLWTPEQALAVLTPILTEHVDVLITSLEDMVSKYGIGCGQYSPEQVLAGDIGPLEDDDIRAFAGQVHQRFNTKIVAITRRYPDTFEQHRWESVAVDSDGNFFRSPAIRSMTLLDRLGGGDAWTAGFYYGLLTEDFTPAGLEKGVLVGDAATRLQQTLMFDLPVIDKGEIQALLETDVRGGGNRVNR
jgi:2-dehydro-3-deoxygluconokinase